MIGSYKMAPAVLGMLVGLGTQAGQGVMGSVFGPGNPGGSPLPWTMQNFPPQFIGWMQMNGHGNLLDVANSGVPAAASAARTQVQTAFNMWSEQNGSAALGDPRNTDEFGDDGGSDSNAKWKRIALDAAVWGVIILAVVGLVKLVRGKGRQRVYRRRRTYWPRRRYTRRRRA